MLQIWHRHAYILYSMLWDQSLLWQKHTVTPIWTQIVMWTIVYRYFPLGILEVTYQICPRSKGLQRNFLERKRMKDCVPPHTQPWFSFLLTYPTSEQEMIVERLIISMAMHMDFFGNSMASKLIRNAATKAFQVHASLPLTAIACQLNWLQEITSVGAGHLINGI